MQKTYGFCPKIVKNTCISSKNLKNMNFGKIVKNKWFVQGSQKHMAFIQGLQKKMWSLSKFFNFVNNKENTVIRCEFRQILWKNPKFFQCNSKDCRKHANLSKNHKKFMNLSENCRERGGSGSKFHQKMAKKMQVLSEDHKDIIFVKRWQKMHEFCSNIANLVEKSWKTHKFSSKIAKKIWF